jgi:hypothetical protein
VCADFFKDDADEVVVITEWDADGVWCVTSGVVTILNLLVRDVEICYCVCIVILMMMIIIDDLC